LGYRILLAPRNLTVRATWIVLIRKVAVAVAITRFRTHQQECPRGVGNKVDSLPKSTFATRPTHIDPAAEMNVPC